MNFLKKIFANSKVDAGDNKGKEKAFVARPLRLPSVFLDQVELFIETAAGEVKVPVLNLSRNGLALGITDSLEFGNSFSGRLFLKPQQGFAVKLEVIHRSQDTLGCKIVEIPDDFYLLFNQVFHDQLMAGAFLKVDQGMLKKTDEGEPYWFFDRKDNEVYYILKDQQIPHFTISFDGFYIEGGVGRPLKTGKVVIEKVRGALASSSRVIEYDRVINQESLAGAVHLLENLRYFCEGDFSELEKLIKKK